MRELLISGKATPKDTGFQWKMFAMNGLVPTQVPMSVLGEVLEKPEHVLPQNLSDSEAVELLLKSFTAYVQRVTGEQRTTHCPPALKRILVEFYHVWKEHKPERLFPILPFLVWRHKTIYEKKSSRSDFMPIAYAFNPEFIIKPSNLAWVRKEIEDKRAGELVISTEAAELMAKIENYRLDYTKLQSPTKYDLKFLNDKYFPGYTYNIMIGLAMLGQNSKAVEFSTEVRRVFSGDPEEYTFHYSSLECPKQHPGYKIHI